MRALIVAVRSGAVAPPRCPRCPRPRRSVSRSPGCSARCVSRSLTNLLDLEVVTGHDHVDVDRGQRLRRQRRAGLGDRLRARPMTAAAGVMRRQRHAGLRGRCPAAPGCRPAGPASAGIFVCSAASSACFSGRSLFCCFSTLELGLQRAVGRLCCASVCACRSATSARFGEISRNQPATRISTATSDRPERSTFACRSSHSPFAIWQVAAGRRLGAQVGGRLDVVERRRRCPRPPTSATFVHGRARCSPPDGPATAATRRRRRSPSALPVKVTDAHRAAGRAA